MLLSANNQNLHDRYAGLLLGTAVGDALGLPAENLSPQIIKQRWGGVWKMRFLFGWGMISDDTEHTLMVAQTLLEHSSDVTRFQRSLAWKFRWWFAALPGGVGLATARACLKLWLGFPSGKNAVNSGGSGPAMRSAIIGAYFAHDPDLRKQFVLASTHLTHRGWQAETAALAVAEISAAIQNNQSNSAPYIFERLSALSSEPEWQKLLAQIQNSLTMGHSVSNFALSLNLARGVTGYALHVVPVALYAWFRHPTNFREAIEAALNCGGDTDTVGAILGGLSGMANGPSTIPAEWHGKILEWPRSIAFMDKVADRLTLQHATSTPLGAVKYFWPAVTIRNLFFIAIVLLHGFQRLAHFLFFQKFLAKAEP